MSQYKLMRGIILSALGLALSAGFFIPFQMTHAAVLYEQSHTGTAYDIFADVGMRYGFYTKLPQYSGEPPIFAGGGVSYSGTAEWLRVKRISGLACDAPFDILIVANDGSTQIGNISRSSGITNGDYCDFPITGSNRTDMAVGGIFICLLGDCDEVPGTFVLDGSPQNEGYVADGTQTIFEKGGWAFQICDSVGCEGGFEIATSTGTTTATTTDPGTGTTTATSTATSTATTTGASSVLFLPGIMGSHLYEQGQQCNDLGTEQQRWFSINDCEQLRLLTDSGGESINDIYTKASNDSVIDEVLGQNLYKSFFIQLANWKAEGKINDYALVPYDWRLRLDDLLKAKADQSTGVIRPNPSGTIQEGYLYQTLENLVASSSSGKVTIVAHSNGGLLAKTFLATLQNTSDPLLSKVDNLILVASPQVGTPDTLMGMLHGSEIGLGGFVVSNQTSRTLLNTMPFGFHLLPNKSYFDSTGVTVDTPVITFEQGTVTTPWINTFGQSIADAGTMERFMTIDGGRIRPETADLTKPEVVPKYLFDNYTKSIDELINTWVPPETMQVKQIAGVGVETLSGLEYFTDTECISRNFLLVFKCTAYAPKLGMRPIQTIDGDGTVVAPSALAMSETLPNVERWWLNLRQFNNDVLINRVHKDIFEVLDVSHFVANTLFATTSNEYTYLSDVSSILPNEKRLTFTLHSPLDLVVVNSRGEVVSSSTEEINGGTYQRYGEVQYISIPDSGNPVTTTLNGEATGSFTLEIATFANGVLDKRYSYSAIPSSTSTKATIVANTDLPLATTPLQVDYDGNGTNDVSYDTKGVIEPIITYMNLFDGINKLETKLLYKKLLTENAKIAQQYHTKSLTNVKYRKLELLALGVLRQQVLFYERSKIINPAESKELVNIINSLSK
ncbi:MAG: lipase/acyltransferase domain-containing protein [Candidatus Paceibacteria bacterium]